MQTWRSFPDMRIPIILPQFLHVQLSYLAFSFISFLPVFEFPQCFFVYFLHGFWADFFVQFMPYLVQLPQHRIFIFYNSCFYMFPYFATPNICNEPISISIQLYFLLISCTFLIGLILTICLKFHDASASISFIRVQASNFSIPAFISGTDKQVCPCHLQSFNHLFLSQLIVTAYS